MRSCVAGLLFILGASNARAQARPSDSAAVILVIADSNATASLGGQVAAATRAALIRLRDPKLWVVSDPFQNLGGVGPPDALPIEDILELGKGWGAAIMIQIVATPQSAELRVRVAPRLILRQSPPILIGRIDAVDVTAAGDALAERIASDSALRRRAIDDDRRAREARPQASFEFQVDRAARVADPKQQPPYPDALRPRRLEGEVLAQFVVDSSGRVDPTTFKVLKSTAPEFTDAVRAFLGETSFLPAERRGHHVNQLVQLPFQFAP